MVRAQLPRNIEATISFVSSFSWSVGFPGRRLAIEASTFHTSFHLPDGSPACHLPYHYADTSCERFSHHEKSIVITIDIYRYLLVSEPLLRITKVSLRWNLRSPEFVLPRSLCFFRSDSKSIFEHYSIFILISFFMCNVEERNFKLRF